LEEQSVLGSRDVTGKGGHHKIYYPLMDEKGYVKYLIKTMVESMRRDFPERQKKRWKSTNILNQTRVPTRASETTPPSETPRQRTPSSKPFNCGRRITDNLIRRNVNVLNLRTKHPQRPQTKPRRLNNSHPIANTTPRRRSRKSHDHPDKCRGYIDSNCLRRLFFFKMLLFRLN